MRSQGKLLVLGILALAGISAYAAWWATHVDVAHDGSATGPVFEDPNPPAKRAPARASERERVEAPSTASGDSPADLSPGRVRGQIELPPGAAPLAQFELLVDSAGTPTQHFGFQGTERLVTLDLPLGKSVLSARADGWASRLVTIERTPTSAALPLFHLALEPAGGLNGRALDVRGAPLPGLPVALAATASQDVRTTVCDSEGRYDFPDVPAGGYRVAFGAQDGPIAPVVAAEVVAREVREVPPQSMPELGEGEIRVLDRASRPVAGARVFGAGQSGGWIDGVSDASGLVRARFLPAGTFFLNVTAEGGRTGQGPLEVGVGRIGRANIQIRD